jgi:hypothetical protein
MTLVRLTLAVQQALQRLRARDVRDRFDAEEQQVFADDLARLRTERGPGAVLRQWPALLRDGVADAVTSRRVSPRDTVGRRMVDLGVTASLAGPALAVTAALAALVRATSRGPAFVAVTYVGRDGHHVQLHKLRTMTVAEPRQVTALGRVLRRTRLDEVPSLLALARGDLTLVGPSLRRPDTATPALTIRPGLIRSR